MGIKKYLKNRQIVSDSDYEEICTDLEEEIFQMFKFEKIEDGDRYKLNMKTICQLFLSDKEYQYINKTLLKELTLEELVSLANEN